MRKIKVTTVKTETEIIEDDTINDFYSARITASITPTMQEKLDALAFKNKRLGGELSSVSGIVREALAIFFQTKIKTIPRKKALK